MDGEEGIRKTKREKNMNKPEIPFTLHISGDFFCAIFLLLEDTVISTLNEVHIFPIVYLWFAAQRLRFRAKRFVLLQPG